MNTFNLETIFNLIDLPKAKKQPPPNARVLKHFYGEDFHRAVRELGDLRLRKETKAVIRTLYFYREGGEDYLSLVEVGKE